jgi:hypothetical protein
VPVHDISHLVLSIILRDKEYQYEDTEVPEVKELA